MPPETTLPTGSVTLLFSDIEGSTAMLRRLGDAYADVLAAHRELLTAAWARNGGVVIEIEGDSFYVAFARARDAVTAATEAQAALAAHDWPEGGEVRVRMGIHTGELAARSGSYVGLAVHYAARLCAAAHGGQVLLSESTRALVDAPAEDLGEHRVKDFPVARRLFHLVLEGRRADSFPPLRTLEATSTLPRFATGFVGRAELVAELRERLAEARLLTLTGPGGTGKTRLAVEAATGLGSVFPDGVTFTDLAAVTDPRLAFPTIAGALRLSMNGSRTAEELVVEHLSDRRALLVLDNLEQILSVAGSVGRLLEAAPRSAVLATSRSPLSLRAEQEFPVPPMGLPEVERGDVREIRESEAVSLFLERAKAVDPAFELDGETARVVAQICARLDGLPLAIELAASRVRVLPPAELLARLDRRLSILTGGPRDAPARQRTLREAIAWGYELLEAPAARLLSRLAVFASGWTFSAAEEVANPHEDLGDTVAGIDALLQASMAQRQPAIAQARFGMLGTIREFALERLEESGEAAEVERRHAEWCLRLATEAAPYLIGPDRRGWQERIAADHDNLRAALAWAIAHDEGEIAMRIATGIWRFWQLRGHLAEGRRTIEAALALPSSRSPELAAVRARALLASAGLAYWQGEIDALREGCEESLAIARRTDDRWVEAEALFNLSFVGWAAGDRESALARLAESQALFEALGDAMGLGHIALARAFGAVGEADEPEIDRNARQALELLGRSGDELGALDARRLRGQAAALRGDTAQALAIVRETLELSAEASEISGVVIALLVLAALTNREGGHERASRLLGAIEAIRDRYEASPPVGMALRLAAIHGVDPDLDAPANRAAFAEGRAMTLEEAVALGLAES